MFETLTLFLIRLLGLDEIGFRTRWYRRKGMSIGQNTRIYSRIASTEPYLLEFGDNVTVSEAVHFITHDNSITKMFLGERNEQLNTFGRIRVGNGCFVGLGAIVLPGVELGEGVVVGAGSVVTRSFLDPGTIVAGNPARRVSNAPDYLRENGHFAVYLEPTMSREERKRHILASGKLMQRPSQAGE